MKKTFIVCIFFLFFFNISLHAQSSGVYLIPRQIYVGDPAVLVMHLPASLQNDTIIFSSPIDNNLLPKDPNIDFTKITLERRTVGSRLLVEFTAFVPGTHEFPVIEIGGEYFPGLTITVNTILDSHSLPILSGAATALAMPGTALMLYSFIFLLIILILFSIWFIFKGRTVIQKLQKKWKRYRLFINMKKTEKQLSKALIKRADKRIILDKLSDEFREFLSILTENNCRSKTAREFEQQEDGAFLSKFFHSCDELRFCGSEINSEDISRLLDDLRSFLDIKSKEEKTS